MKIVLAYSGGLDTSVILAWLKEKYDAEIITFAADIGQEEELNGLAEKAKRTGASEHYTIDLVEEFASDFIYPMMRANTLYEGQYHLGTSIARPLIAKAQVELARKVGATHVSHGATGKGNDQVRFELSYAAMAPELEVITPWRMPEFRAKFPGRTEMIAYCQEKGINVEATAKKPYSMDRNLLHISYEAGIVEDAWFNAHTPENKNMFKLSVDPADAPNEAEYVELEFERGDCVALNGTRMNPAAILRALNKLGGKHGVGRVDMVENRFVGMKSRGIYETPGGSILLAAHRNLEGLVLDREVVHLRDMLMPKYAEMIYYGTWYAPERECLQAFIDKSQEQMNGIARIKLFKGNIICCGTKSPVSLYNANRASMEGVKSDYNPDDATGLIHLNALRLKTRYMVQGGPDIASESHIRKG